MPGVIEQFTAERDKKLQRVLQEASEQYSRLSEEINEETEQRILDFYREHPEEIEDVLNMIKEEAPKYIIKASEEVDASFTHGSSMNPIVPISGNKQLTLDSNVVLNDDTLRTHIFSAFKAYLDLLNEISPDHFQNACNLLEQCIINKTGIIEEWKKQVDVCGLKNKTGRWDVLYRQMRQNSVTNQFNKISRLSSERGLKVDYEGKASYTRGNITVGILDYRKLFNNLKGNFNITTKRLTDMIIIEFTSNGNDPFIRIPLDIYMEKCGLRDKKKARKQVNDALELLFVTAISYDDSVKKNKSKNYRDMRIIDDKGIRNGVIYVHFAQPFAEMLSNDCSIMPYPLALLRLKGGKTCPHAYPIGRRMAEHKYMNAGKANENVIAVRTLIEACDDLPTEEEVRNSQNRSLVERIARPFLDSLEEACKQIGIGENGYYLTYEKGERISDQELYNLSYDNFINTYVHFDEWPDYPDQTKRIEARKAMTSKKLTKKKNKA